MTFWLHSSYTCPTLRSFCSCPHKYVEMYTSTLSTRDSAESLFLHNNSNYMQQISIFFRELQRCKAAIEENLHP